MTVGLGTAQRAAADRVIAEEGAQRRHLMVGVTGSHACGLASEDSDVDLKAIHVEPSERWLGLGEPALAANRLEIVCGIEIDYTCNEIKPVLASAIHGNGNYLERVLGPLVLVQEDGFAELRMLVARSLSRRVFGHYHGFASGQLKQLAAAAQPKVKQALYVLRVALTGVRLLGGGGMAMGLTELADDYGFAGARDWMERKRAERFALLDGGERSHWLGELSRALRLLEDARDHSELPAECPNAAELDGWLVALRKK